MASGLFVFLRLGELYLKAEGRKFVEESYGTLIESPRIRYTSHLEVKIRIYIEGEREGVFLVDPRKGSAYLIDPQGKELVRGISSSRPSKLKNVAVRMHTRTG